MGRASVVFAFVCFALFALVRAELRLVSWGPCSANHPAIVSVTDVSLDFAENQVLATAVVPEGVTVTTGSAVTSAFMGTVLAETWTVPVCTLMTCPVGPGSHNFAFDFDFSMIRIPATYRALFYVTNDAARTHLACVRIEIAKD